MSDYTLDEMLAIYMDELKKNPDSGTAYHNVGSIYYKKQDYEKTIEYYSKSIELMPNFAPFYFARSDVYFYIGEYLKAKQDCEKGLKLDPNNQEAQELMEDIISKIRVLAQEYVRTGVETLPISYFTKARTKRYFLFEAIKDYCIWLILVFSLQLIKNYYMEYGLHFNGLFSYLKNIDWAAYTSSFEVHTFSIGGFFLLIYSMISILKTDSSKSRKKEIFFELKFYNRIFLIAVVNIGWIFAPLFALISVILVIGAYIILAKIMSLSFNYILCRIILTIILTISDICLSVFFSINTNSPYTLFFATIILYYVAKTIDFFIIGLDSRTKFTQKMRKIFNIQ